MSTRKKLRGQAALAALSVITLTAVSACEKPPAVSRGVLTPSTQPAATAATRPATNPAAAVAGWRELFDGKTLKNWKSSGFAAQGEPVVENGLLVLPAGEGLTGVTWDGGDLPKVNYEVEVVAKKMEGADFFCGLTFPVKDSHASLIVGGWGGAVVGISNIDDADAAHNDTTVYEKFDQDRWYTVRMRVLPEKLQAWIDDKRVIDISIKGKKIELRVGIDEAKPFGVASYATTAAIKSVKIRKVDQEGE